MRHIKLLIHFFAIFLALDSDVTLASSHKYINTTYEGRIRVQIKNQQNRFIKQTDFKPFFLDVGEHINKQIQSCHSCIKVQSMYYQLPWRHYWPR